LTGFVALGLGMMGGCATSVEESDDDRTTVASTGGSTSSTGGQIDLPCGVDCSAIATPQCQVSQCNEALGKCEVVPDTDGAACDDGEFCTVEDSCQAGVCMGGPENDCGMDPAPCTSLSCDEASKSCNETPAMNGAACQDPNNLCVHGSTCSNGACIGGMPDDCFFFPVPDDCHVAACNPTTGMCEAQPGNEGLSCVDPNDLCTLNKTCASGMCQGGTPKDCSGLTQGCVLGICDTTNGMCTTQTVTNGQPCDDLNACTNGELCQNGNCSGGTPVTTCTSNDGCCPSNCNPNNDIDCACMPGSAQFNPTGSGNTGTIQTFSVPSGCSSITIEAWGAQGGTGTDTKGARMKGTFTVTPGSQLSILVGHQGDTAVSGTSGGGGTFVVNSANQPLIIAGGGGSCFTTCPATSETVGRITTSGGTAGSTMRADNGQGGNVANMTSGGGGGFFSNGANSTGGKSWANGGQGGLGENFGGFGGGGARGGLWGQGGGGGYSGGSCGDLASSWLGCGGGGSFNTGTNQNNTAGAKTGHGMVVITW
jgi:hypothetical protein